MLFNASKIQFLHLSTRHNPPNRYSLFFSDTQLSPSPTLNILGLSFTSNLNWKLHISSLAKTASMKLGVLSRLRQFYLTSPTANSIQGTHPPMYGVSFTCLGRLHSYSSFEQGGIKSFSSYQLLSSDCLQPPSHRRNVASLAIFYNYFHANYSSDLANCVPPLLPRPRCTRLASSSHPYSVHLCNARV